MAILRPVFQARNRKSWECVVSINRKYLKHPKSAVTTTKRYRIQIAIVQPVHFGSDCVVADTAVTNAPGRCLSSAEQALATMYTQGVEHL